MTTRNQFATIDIEEHDKDACIEKMKGTKVQLQKQRNKQRQKAWKRGKAVKVDARVEYIKEKRDLQREENEKREFMEKKEEVLDNLKDWKEDFFGVHKGKQFRERELEVKEIKNNINDVVEEKLAQESQ